MNSLTNRFLTQRLFGVLIPLTLNQTTLWVTPYNDLALTESPLVDVPCLAVPPRGVALIRR